MAKSYLIVGAGIHSRDDVKKSLELGATGIAVAKDILKAEWIDNPLTLACKYGYTLIYNEFSRSKAVANNFLLSIFI